MVKWIREDFRLVFLKHAKNMFGNAKFSNILLGQNLNDPPHQGFFTLVQKIKKKPIQR